MPPTSCAKEVEIVQDEPVGGHKLKRTNLRVATRIVDSLQAGHPLIFPEIDIQDVWAELGANGEMALCIGYISHFDNDCRFVYRSTMGLPDGWCEWTAESFIYDKASDFNEPVGALVDQAVADGGGILWWGDLTGLDLSAHRERLI